MNKYVVYDRDILWELCIVCDAHLEPYATYRPICYECRNAILLVRDLLEDAKIKNILFRNEV